MPRVKKSKATYASTGLPDWAVEKLTPKERRFVEEYMIDLNARKAFTRCGFDANHGNPNSAQAMASRMLASPSVSDVIERLAAERATTRMWLFDLLSKWVTGDLTDYYIEGTKTLKPFEDLTPEQRLCLKGYRKTEFGDEIELEDRQAAAAKLMKVLRMDVTRVENTGKDGGPIQVESPHEAIMRRYDEIAKRQAEAAERDKVQ